MVLYLNGWKLVVLAMERNVNKVLSILTSLLLSCGSVDRTTESTSQPSDGCSGGSPWAKRLFVDACYNHDVCYRVGDTRAGCDALFLNDMKKICGSSWKYNPCVVEATAMYIAVRANPRGDEVFDKRHRKEGGYANRQHLD
jgi:hypothetical protein